MSSPATVLPLPNDRTGGRVVPPLALSRAAQRFLRLPDGELHRLLALTRQADRVELKVLVPEPAHETTCAALGADLRRARTRRVYFLDTPDLALYHHGVVARVRSIDAEPDDSVIKLRPVDPSRLPAALRRDKRFVVEIDGMPGSYVCSATLKERLGVGQVKHAISAGRPLRDLFAEEQLTLLATHAPAHVRVDDLSIVGPVHVRRCKLTLAGLRVERWTYPDGSRILELSTRCRATAAQDLAAQVADILCAHGIDLAGPQRTKTRHTLDFFLTRQEPPVAGPTSRR